MEDSHVFHTPDFHISVAEVYAENGVVFLKFKKPKSQVYEILTLDTFLALVYQMLENNYYKESFEV